jgi:hypothetical protein
MSFSARTLQDAAAGGGGGLGAYLFPDGVYYSFAIGTTATTTWRARNTGEIQIIGVVTTNYTWLTGGGTNADYEIRWTIISTTPTTGVTGTWINMSVGEDWSLQATLKHKILSRSCRDPSGSGSKYSSGLNNCDLECRE